MSGSGKMSIAGDRIADAQNIGRSGSACFERHLSLMAEIVYRLEVRLGSHRLVDVIMVEFDRRAGFRILETCINNSTLQPARKSQFQGSS